MSPAKDPRCKGSKEKHFPCPHLGGAAVRLKIQLEKFIQCKSSFPDATRS